MMERRLPASPDLQGSLEAARQAFNRSGQDETWILPEGEWTLTGPVSLGRSGRRLTLTGACTLRLQPDGGDGGLTVTGSQVSVEGPTLIGDGVDTALRVTGGVVEIARCRLRGAGAGARLGLVVQATESARLVDVRARDLQGGGARGVTVEAPSIDLIDVEVERVQGAVGADPADTVLLNLAGVSGGAGLVAEARSQGGVEPARIDAVRLTVREIQGPGAVGARLTVGGARPGPITLTDLTVRQVQGGPEPAWGAIALSPDEVVARGLTLAEITGGNTGGLLVGATRHLTVAGGRVTQITSATNASVGIRALLAEVETRPTLGSALEVTDVMVTRISGGAAPLVNPAPGPDWRTWWADEGAPALQAALPGAAAQLTALPTTAGPTGLHLDARVEACDPEGLGDPDPVVVADSVLRGVAGHALQCVGGLRPLIARHLELHGVVSAGYLQGERTLLAQWTLDRHQRGPRIGPGALRALNLLMTRRGEGPPWQLTPGVDLVGTGGVFASDPAPPFAMIGALPYRRPGPGALPPTLLAGSLAGYTDDGVDLTLLDGSSLAGPPAAVPLPVGAMGGTAAAPEAGQAAAGTYVGAWPPAQPAHCTARDPRAGQIARAPVAPLPEPEIDYRARDARTLLALMLDRARVAMPTWTAQGPADQTTMILEAVAARLDHLAYAQERVLEESTLLTARQRRSVEDHARPLDRVIDPGLSATTLLAFSITADRQALRAQVSDWLEAQGEDIPPEAPDHPLEQAVEAGVEVPEGTLVANPQVADGAMVFATESALIIDPELDRVPLARPCLQGASEAWLDGTLDLEDRWALIEAPGLPDHPVLITVSTPVAGGTWVQWDPRRPAPATYPAGATLRGNLAPAHHGMPLPHPLGGPWAEPIEVRLPGGPGQEVQLPPTAPLSWHAPGYPLPAEALGGVRMGSPRLSVTVDGEPWQRTADLALSRPEEEVFALRSGLDGAVIRFGDGLNGAALPDRPVVVDVRFMVGSGAEGNIGPGRLSRVLAFEAEGLRRRLGAPEGQDWAALLAALVQVEQPIAATGGRDPEPLETIRRRAPIQATTPVSAVALADYADRLEALPEVAGARARLLPDAGLRPVIHLTVLLRDEDTLDSDERLRRWAVVRRRAEEIRLLGFDVRTGPPRWVPLDLDLSVDAAPWARPADVRTGVEAALAGDGGLLDPDQSGLGGDVYLDAVYRAVRAVSGVQSVWVLRFRRLAAGAQERLGEGRIPVAADEVAVLRGPGDRDADGLLTVTVCGGLQG